jgi:aquaporin Z
VVHLFAIPLDGTSVNPARSLGPALFAGGDSLKQVWLFIVAPLVGAVVAVGLVRLITPPVVTEVALRDETGVDATGAQVPAEADAVPTARQGAHDDYEVDVVAVEVEERRPPTG